MNVIDVRNILKNGEDIVWSDNSTELDDLAYYYFINVIRDENIIQHISDDMGVDYNKISFSTVTQNDLIKMKNENAVINTIYELAKNEIRKNKINKLLYELRRT